MSKTVEVDTKTFVRFWLVILGFGLAALFIWKAWEALMIIGIALFLTIAIRPLAQRINRLTKKDHSASSSIIAYILVIGVLGVVVAMVGPVVIEQTTQFVQQLPQTFEHTLGGWDGINDFGQTIGIDNLQNEIATALQNFSSSFVSNIGNTLVMSVGTVAKVLTNIILTIVLTLFFSLEGPSIIDAGWNVIEGRRKNSAVRAWKRLAGRMVDVVSTYVSHQAMVALLDGLVVTIVVLLLSFTFGLPGGLALPMGLLAMVFYLIPMFGPIISCMLITLVLLFSSPVAAAIFLVFYIIYAQIENNVIAPKIQGNALNLPATMVLVAIIIGMNIFGLLGAIIAIPIAGCIKVIVEELPNLREAEAKEDVAEACVEAKLAEKCSSQN
jgi:predicted PurR-regulated permease PerM